MHSLIYITIALLCLYFLFRPKQRKGQVASGPYGWPLVGVGFAISQTNIHEKFSEYAIQYGDIFKVNIFGSKLVVLNSTELVRKAYNDDPYKKYMNDRSTSFYSDNFYNGGQSIGTTRHAFESDHGPLRKGFIQALKVYGEGRIEFENKVQSELKVVVDSLRTYGGNEFDFKHTIKRSLANVIAAVLGGHDIDIKDDYLLFWKFDELTDFFLNQSVDSVMRAFPFLRFIPSIYKQRYHELMLVREPIILKYFYNIKATHKPGVVRGLIDHLIGEQIKAQENGDHVLFTDERIISILMETIAVGMPLATVSSTVLCLINHPEYQKKIQEELDTVIGKDRLPTFSDKPKCPFVEAVVLETLRYIPVGPLLFPHLCRPNINFEGYDIEANSLIVANAWFIHHDEKIWGDPWVFRPERFLDDNGQLLPHDHIYRKSWLPFSTGRRQCVGESFARSRLFLFIATLLQNFTFTMETEKRVSCDPRKGAFSFGLVCTPKPFMCKAVPRLSQQTHDVISTL